MFKIIAKIIFLGLIYGLTGAVIPMTISLVLYSGFYLFGLIVPHYFLLVSSFISLFIGLFFCLFWYGYIIHASHHYVKFIIENMIGDKA